MMKRITLALTCLIMAISCAQKEDSGYVGPSDIRIEDGVMTPETLLSLGRLSDPQLSPDGNRSCRNLFLCNPDGSGKVQLTRYAKSVSAARWANDGKSIFFLQGGQLWNAPLNGNKLGRKVQLSDVPNGISDYKLSPDQNQVLYVSSVKNTALQQPADQFQDLDKAQAYTTENLMYRHWDHWVTEVPRTYVATLVNGMITPDNSLDILGTDNLYELPTEPFGGAEQLDWAPDSRHIVYSCRKKTGKQYAFSTNTSIYIYDLLTGETLDVKTDGGYDTDPVWSPDGKHIAWVSMARDGSVCSSQTSNCWRARRKARMPGWPSAMSANSRRISTTTSPDWSGTMTSFSSTPWSAKASRPSFAWTWKVMCSASPHPTGTSISSPPSPSWTRRTACSCSLPTTA